MTKLLIIFIILSLLTVGVILDSRFSISRKLLLIIFNIVQIFIYEYLDTLPILLLKDMFWFSVLLNCAFIWHVLILSWLLEVLLKYDYKKGVFFISRLSLFTSLSFIRLILCEFLLIIEMINHYSDKMTRFYTQNKSKISDVLWFDLIFYFVDVIILGFLRINDYFIKGFLFYSLLLLGKNETIDYKSTAFIKFVVIFVIVLILAFYLNLPRIYLIWIFYILYEFIMIFVESIKYLRLCIDNSIIFFGNKPFSFIRYFLGFIKQELIVKLRKNIFGDKWKLIYNSEIYLDYYCFIEDIDWFGCYDLACGSVIKFNVYDILEIFYFKENLRIYIYGKLIFRMWDGVIVSDDVFEQFIKDYNLKITLVEFKNFVYPKLKSLEDGVIGCEEFLKDGLVEFKLFSPEQDNNSLYEFLFGLRYGNYYFYIDATHA